MKKIVLLVLFSFSMLFGAGDLHLFEIQNKDGAITPTTVEEAFKKSDFMIAVNSEMNYPYKKQFKKTKFQTFNLLTIYHKTISAELVKKYPEAGVLTPFGVGIYQAKDEDVLHLSFLTSEAQAKILGVDDELLKKLEQESLKAIRTNFKDAKHSISEDSLKESRGLVSKFELELDGEDFDEAREEIEMNLENGFAPFGFVMPNYMDYNDEIKSVSNGKTPFDFYVSYSICKLKVIYTVSLTRPEASAFAPCTLMLYKKKDEDKIVLGFPAVYNWMSSARVKDKDSKEVLLKAQKDFESVLKDITE
ncbi:hypothetical protein M947_02005 [Sulfurimonas hongkongensis]|uniref:DUF302 domain-containing protein n=1 Tax=Sulfurimonas hongkongensis TaxID=1172190 RepID=T0JU47_9BACT|nr:hypothetical protein [Sulfurimonas hongkongensis]EQB40602.1 hypothetical protein M947_02005 [Sulfurimonas hongkongensis]